MKRAAAIVTAVALVAVATARSDSSTTEPGTLRVTERNHVPVFSKWYDVGTGIITINSTQHVRVERHGNQVVIRVNWYTSNVEVWTPPTGNAR